MTNAGCTIREWWGERAVTGHVGRLVIGPLLTSRLANIIILMERCTANCRWTLSSIHRPVCRHGSRAFDYFSFFFLHCRSQRYINSHASPASIPGPAPSHGVTQDLRLKPKTTTIPNRADMSSANMLLRRHAATSRGPGDRPNRQTERRHVPLRRASAHMHGTRRLAVPRRGRR